MTGDIPHLTGIPTELKAIAEQLVRDYGHDPEGLLVGAIAAALLCERNRRGDIPHVETLPPPVGQK